jgi:Antibiotic biosynthesis monooxygenase
MADVLTVIGKIRAPKGKGDALAALLKEQVAAVRKTEPGCLAQDTINAEPRMPEAGAAHRPRPGCPPGKKRNATGTLLTKCQRESIRLTTRRRPRRPRP